LSKLAKIPETLYQTPDMERAKKIVVPESNELCEN